VFRDVFDDEAIEISEKTTAKDIDGWDSLNHINLIVATEQRFRVKFTTREVNGLANVGGLISLIQQKMS
jgi:acyl carrier protein